MVCFVVTAPHLFPLFGPVLAVEAHRLMLCCILRLLILPRSRTQGPAWKTGCRNADEDGTSVRRARLWMCPPLRRCYPVQDSIGLKPRFCFTKDNIQHEGYTVVNKRGGFFGGFNGPGWLVWREGWVAFPCIDPF